MLVKNSFSYLKATVPVFYGKESEGFQGKICGHRINWRSKTREPSTWELGNSLTLMEFLVSDSDVAVDSCTVFGPDKMRSSSLFP